MNTRARPRLPGSKAEITLRLVKRRLGEGLCLLSILAVGCKASGAAARQNSPGTLPEGCSIVAHLKPSELGTLGTLLGRLMSTPVSRIAVPGLDLNHGANEVTFCRLAAPVNAVSQQFVVLVSGGVKADFMKRVADLQHLTLERDTVARVPVLGHDRLWLARRGSDGESGELVLASQLDVLRATLVGPAGVYTRGDASPFSMVISRGELERITTVASASSTRNADGSRLGVAREVQFNLSPSGDDLTARFVVGDAASARRLTELVQPALASLIRQSAGSFAHDQPDVSVSVEAGDAVARVHLPKGSIESLIQRATAMKGTMGFAQKSLRTPPS